LFNSAIFAGLINVTNTHTDTHTDRQTILLRLSPHRC